MTHFTESKQTDEVNDPNECTRDSDCGKNANCMQNGDCQCLYGFKMVAEKCIKGMIITQHAHNCLMILTVVYSCDIGFKLIKLSSF